MLPPPAATKPKTPIAFARSAGSVNKFIISESETAEATAPPSPCTARAAIRVLMSGASAAAAEATVKIPSPIEKVSRRPIRSPMAAPVRSRTAKVSV